LSRPAGRRYRSACHDGNGRSRNRVLISAAGTVLTSVDEPAQVKNLVTLTS